MMGNQPQYKTVEEMQEKLGRDAEGKNIPKSQPTEASEKEWKELDKQMSKKTTVKSKRARLKEIEENKRMRDEEKELDKKIKSGEFEERHPTFVAAKKKVGNIIASGVKEVISDGHGRSGKRATLAYRRENRDYQSESRKMRKEVTSPGSFTSKMMFGEDKVPVRSRYVGHGEFAGTADPLSNFSSGILGLPRVQQDTTIEGAVPKAQRRKYAKPKPQKENSLTSFSKSLWRMKL